jgi:TRAP-type transport system periplasmic protein
MKRWPRLMVGVVGFLLLSAGLSHAQAPKFQKTWKVFFTNQFHQFNWQGAVVQQWAKEIEDRTRGALKIQIYWPGQLPYKGYDSLTTIQNRLTDAGECLTTFYGTTHPIMDFRWHFFSIEKLDDYEKVVNKVLRKYYQPVFDKYGVIPIINTTSGGDHNWFSTGPVTKMEQMKGYKTRSFSKAVSDMVKAWGCQPLTIPLVELYTALQRGVCNAVVTSYISGADMKFWEVLPYAVDINWAIAGYNTVIANRKAWEELPPDVQGIVRDAGDKASAEIFRLQPIEEKKLRDLFKKNGVKILQLEPGEREKLRKATTFLWKEWLDMNGDVGLSLLKEAEQVTGLTILKEIGK